MFEFVLQLIGPKSIQYANGASGRDMHRTLSAAFTHDNCVNLLPKINRVGGVNLSLLSRKIYDFFFFFSD